MWQNLRLFSNTARLHTENAPKEPDAPKEPVREGAPKIFNRSQKMIQRDNVARRPDRREFSNLRLEVAERLLDRLDDIKMK